MTKLPLPAAFREPAGVLLGTRAKVAVLRTLAGGAAPLSQRELARRARVAPRSVNMALEDLIGMGLVRRHVGGREHLLSLAHEHVLAPALTALFAADTSYFTDLCRALADEAQVDGGSGLALLALVGSVARGHETAASDVDLLLIGRTRADAERWRAYYLAAAQRFAVRFGAQLNPLAYSLAEARNRWRQRAAPLPELARDALVLLGPPIAEVLDG